MTEPTPVLVRGELFPSINACARRFGITRQAVQDALNRGAADSIGKGRNWWHKQKDAAE